MAMTSENIKLVSAHEGPAYWQMGISLVTFKATSEDTGGRYVLFEVWDAPDSGPPMHRHQREDEAYYILEGEYDIYYPESPTPLHLSPGAYAHVPRGTIHTYKCVGPNGGRMLVMASPGGLENFFAELGVLAEDREHPPVMTAPPDFGWVVSVAAKYEIEVTGPPPA